MREEEVDAEQHVRVVEGHVGDREAIATDDFAADLETIEGGRPHRRAAAPCAVDDAGRLQIRIADARTARAAGGDDGRGPGVEQRDQALAVQLHVGADRG